MAEIKKYLDTAALGTLVDQIKAEDAKVLKGAKDYADGLAKNYDATGAAATAETNAKAYTDALANGQVATNKADIAKLNGDAQTEGSVAKAIADAQATIGEEIDAVEAKADAAQDAADKAQGEIDALEAFVGELPEGSAATSVIDYVNVKTAGIATDAALGELNNQVAGLQTVVNGITADYLKAADKKELSDAIVAEETRAKGVESGFETRIKAIEDDYLTSDDAATLQSGIDGVAEDVAEISKDYLKAADKTEIQGKIDTKADQTALDAEIERATGVEANLQTQINTILNNPDAEGAINSINEFTKYIADHGEIADGFRTDINKNKDDIAAMDTDYKAADTAIKGRLDVLEAIDHDAYVAADTALKTELEGKINAKADASALTSAVETLTAADTAMQGRLDTIEAQLGDGEGSVVDLIADAKAEAIATAAEDATSKANAAEAAAKGYTDTEIDKVEGTISTLTETVNGKAAQSEVTTLSGKVGTLETDMAQAKTDIDAVEALAAANKAAHEANAAAIALKASQADLDAAVGRIAQNETDIKALQTAVADKAEQDDLDAAVERIAANETAIAANTSAINSFTAITSDEVNAMFA